MSNHLYNKTGILSRFLLRQDRIRIPVWLLSLFVFTFLIAESFTSLYPAEQDRQALAETMLNPAMTAMVGPGYGLENYTFGAMMAHQMLLFTAVTVGIMNILLLARHTRAAEEDGRIEMVRSLPVGRLSNLLAAIAVLFGTNVLLALGIGFGLYVLGIDSMSLNGSLLYGAALGAIGFFFTGVTALFAQLSESSRGAIGLSFTVLGVSYLIRAIGDVSNETLSWFSPLGWILGAEVYVNNYWQPVFITAAASIVLVAFALYLHSIRDTGLGFLPSKPGRTFASPFLQSPFGLAFRLLRTAIISWAVGMVLIGVSYGSVFGDLESFFNEIDVMEDLIGPVTGVSLTEQFAAKLMSVISMISTIPALMVILKLKSEEKKARTEHVLARAVSRTRLLASYLFIALFVGFVMISMAAGSLGLTAVTVMDDGLSFGTFYSAAIVYLPAIWVMTGIAVLLVGFAPNASGLTWLYLGYSFIVVYLGGLFQFKDWVGNLSPFAHIPQLPVEEMDLMKVSILTIITIVLLAAGFIGYNRRDIHG
ncbi:ABC transporter permease [Alteribacillus sp. YIM 98480]|uniref:ABC transporter permease n=1 Tax=Alteribacillus sp. YIM 98480 TaxID=2606599 RepID=UPI00131CE8B6|nr:ABC transporter permease [Alteribacillus sp. YIM 98480]